MVQLELEDIQGNKYQENIPQYPSAEIANQCEATFNAQVKATGTSESGKIDNAYQAIAEQKRIVVNWLNDNWFDNDLGPEKLSPPSQDKIMREYADYIQGVAVEDKKKVDGNGEKSGNESGNT